MHHPPAMCSTVHPAVGGTVYKLTTANVVVPTIVPSTAAPGVALLSKLKPWSPI